MIVRWIDGDTFVVNIDQGFHDWKHNQHLRLLGIDAPDKQPAKEAARAYVADKWPAGTEVVIRTVRDKRGDEMVTFERWLAEAWDRDGAYGDSISDLIIDAGHAQPYNGRAR